MELRRGVFPPLEQQADALIFGSLKGVTSQEAKSDILTPWKEADRRSREVQAHSGTVDPQIRRGLYHRAANKAKPYLNSRDCIAPPIRSQLTGNTWSSSSDGAHDTDTE